MIWDQDDKLITASEKTISGSKEIGIEFTPGFSRADARSAVANIFIKMKTYLMLSGSIKRKLNGQAYLVIKYDSGIGKMAVLN